MDATDGLGPEFTQVSTFSDTSCALRQDGLAACWGVGFVEEPLVLEGPFEQVSASTFYGCFLREDMTLACVAGELGRECETAGVPEGRFVRVDTAVDSNCALDEDGEMVCWGSNEWNQATPPELPP